MINPENEALSKERAYEVKCREFRDVDEQLDALKKRHEELKEWLIDNAGGDRMEHGVKIAQIERKGVIDYGKLLHDMDISKTVVEAYRKDNIAYWAVKRY